MSIQTLSYAKIDLFLDGEEYKELRIPIFWDKAKDEWIGVLKTPKTKYLIVAMGKDVFELRNNFNKEISKLFAEILKRD